MTNGWKRDPWQELKAAGQMIDRLQRENEELRKKLGEPAPEKCIECKITRPNHRPDCSAAAR